MKWNNFIILALLDICMAYGKWKLFGCDKFNKDEIKGTVIEAVTLAGTALEVLNSNFGDEKVQKMVKHILGDDQNLQGKVDRAKELFGNVNNYDKSEALFLGAPFADNTDLMIFCDNSNYEEAGGHRRNKAVGLPIPQNILLPVAMTLSSDMSNDTKYKAALAQWQMNGAQGSPPDRSPYAVPQPNKANTMDLCTWNLRMLGDGGFTSIDDPTIARVQEQSFLDGLPNNDKAIDGLVTSLAGMFLHELTHTNLGGKTVDNDASAGCYGWVCVGNLHDVNNADSIAHLGVCMYLFQKGFWVDDNGRITRI